MCGWRQVVEMLSPTNSNVCLPGKSAGPNLFESREWGYFLEYPPIASKNCDHPSLNWPFWSSFRLRFGSSSVFGGPSFQPDILYETHLVIEDSWKSPLYQWDLHLQQEISGGAMGHLRPCQESEYGDLVFYPGDPTAPKIRSDESMPTADAW